MQIQKCKGKERLCMSESLHASRKGTLAFIAVNQHFKKHMFLSDPIDSCLVLQPATLAILCMRLILSARWLPLK